MTPHEFEKLVSEEPALGKPLRKAVTAVPHSPTKFGAGEIVTLIALYPLVKFVVVGIGLPWLHEGGRYADIWRQKFHLWVDEQYREHGLDPDAADAAGEALRAELEKMTDKEMKAAWEKLAERMKDEG